jgi:hypothetical protein
MLDAMMPVYDALYRWVLDAVEASDEKHNWKQRHEQGHAINSNQPATPTSWKRIALLAQARLHLVWRPGGTDRHHASGARRAASLDQRKDAFLHALNYCMLLPGPEAQQLATYIGWLMHRTWGGVIAGGLFVLPGALIMMALAWGLRDVRQYDRAASCALGH